MLKWLIALFTTPLGLNIFGGILAAFAYAAIGAAWKWLGRMFHRRNFKAFFGKNTPDTGVTLVFPEFVLGGAQPRSRYVKPDGKLPGEEWTPERPVDAGDLRAVGYLSVLFGSELSRPALLQSDIEVHDEFNKDFVSIGFGSNAKTRGVFDNPGNRVTTDSRLIEVDVKQSKIKTLRGKEFVRESGFDYAVILKIHPEQYKDRTWIVCAGERGEGTPSAGWFLANKWQELHKRER